MQQSRLSQLSVLLPEDLATLLRAARDADIETEYVVATGLARLHLDFTDHGPCLPLLGFDTLGGLQLRQKGEPGAETSHFSRTQRECLAALIAAPTGKIDQEQMQLLFWPESSAEKGRSNLDTMLSRLRRTLQDQIEPLQAKHYLKLQKGVVSLEHVATDVRDLLTGLRRGHEFLVKNRYWQADVAFTSALSLWHGPFAPGACSSDIAAEFAERVHADWTEAVLAWAEMLIDLGQSERAEAALAQALGNDRSNEALVSALYRCHMRSGAINRALTLLQQYEESLRRDGCAPTDIARALAAIRTRTTTP
jgi:DNA-binding SARP family transcriptional activator